MNDRCNGVFKPGTEIALLVKLVTWEQRGNVSCQGVLTVLASSLRALEDDKIID